MIVDDNSNYDFISKEDEDLLTNCVIVNSEYHQRGELLAYYYFHVHKPFLKAIIIHDSVFLIKKLSEDIINNINDIQFLWHFPSFMDDSYKISIVNIINNLKETDKLVELYKKKELWNGCFGVQSVITYDF